MTTAAEDLSNLSDSGDKTDAIASLLIGDEEDANVDDVTDDSDAEETQSAGSTESDDSDGAEQSEDDGEAEAEASAEGESESAGDGDVTWENVLGVSEEKLSFDEDGNVKGVNIKVNGEASVIPVNDLIAGYQQNKAITIKGQTLAEERKDFEKQREEVAQAYQSKLQDVTAIGEHLEQRLVSEFESVDWNKLRAENPAEYAAARQDYAGRAQELKQIRQAVMVANQEALQEAENVQKQELTQYVSKQYEKMVENNPSWSDEKVFTKDMGALREFCSTEYGFTDTDFALARDARLIELIKDARNYHEGVKLAKEKIGKKQVPKFQKSTGKPKVKKTSKLESLTKAAQKASGAEKRQLQSDAVVELLLGG